MTDQVVRLERAAERMALRRDAQGEQHALAVIMFGAAVLARESSLNRAAECLATLADQFSQGGTR
jgi:hypothetical protein